MPLHSFRAPLHFGVEINESLHQTGVSYDEITFDAASSSGYEASLSTYNWQHTTAGENRALLVSVSIFVSGSVTSITYADQALTFIRAESNGLYRVELWSLIAPRYGTNTITVNLSTSLTSVGSAVSYSGVDQIDMIDTVASANGVGGNPTVSDTPGTDRDWLVSFISTADATTAPVAGQTQRDNNSGVLGSGGISDSGMISPIAATSMSWATVGITDSWAIIVIELIRANAVVTYIDADTVTFALTPSATEIAQFIDTATVSLLLTPSSTDITQYIDSDTELLTLTPLADEVYETSDADTELLSLTPSATETADLVDSDTVILNLTPSASEIAELIDSAIEILLLIPSSEDIASYVDSGTMNLLLVPSSTEIAQYADSDTVGLLLTPSSADVARFIDAATSIVTFTPGGAEVATPSDSGTLGLHLTPASDNIAAFIDAITANLILTPNANEVVEHPDYDQLDFSLTPLTVEELFAHEDAGTLDLLLIPSATEASPVFVDSGTVILYLIPGTTEVQVFVELVGQLLRRWSSGLRIIAVPTMLRRLSGKIN